jgi:hypothetical protein
MGENMTHELSTVWKRPFGCRRDIMRVTTENSDRVVQHIIVSNICPDFEKNDLFYDSFPLGISSIPHGCTQSTHAAIS